MVCLAPHLVVMTGLVPVIHGNVAAREDVDGRIKSGHPRKRGDLHKCDVTLSGNGEGHSMFNIAASG